MFEDWRPVDNSTCERAARPANTDTQSTHASVIRLDERAKFIGARIVQYSEKLKKIHLTFHRTLNGESSLKPRRIGGPPKRTANTPGEHHCASVGTDIPGSWAGEVREFQATTVITRPGVLRLIIHIMLAVALPQNSQIDIGFEANRVSAPKVATT